MPHIHFNYLLGLFVSIFQSNTLLSLPYQDEGMYFATVADTEHYPWVENLIRSLKRCNKGKITAIAVFDIGLTKTERASLAQMSKVTVYPLKMVNPDLCTKFTIRSSGRQARGWYAWKPVAIKQALDLFPYLLYLDAGTNVRAPLDKVFEHIRYYGYFLVETGHTIGFTATEHVIQSFQLDAENCWVMFSQEINAARIGVSRRVLNALVMPMYIRAFDLKNFEDDGSTSGGFGSGRCDQTLWSIYAHLLNLKIYPAECYSPYLEGKIAALNSNIKNGVLAWD